MEQSRLSATSLARVGILALAASSTLAACGPGPRENDDDNGNVDARGDSRPDSRIDTPDGFPQILESKIYAHGNGNLYRIDTVTYQPELIGPITGLVSGSLLDLAVDKDGNALGVTRTSLYTVNLETAAATLLRDGVADDNDVGFSSLSFVPFDLNDANSPERLVAASDGGRVFEINPTSGASTFLGSYGGTGTTLIGSSGDIVAIRGLGIFATVTIGTNRTDPDYLARIDPVTWKATTIGPNTSYDGIFGLGFWGGKFFGFVDNGFDAGSGVIVEINATTGATTPRGTSNIRWFGAGVTTSAPIID